MFIYLIRHADALGVDEAGVNTDAERSLSPEGIRQVQDLAAGLDRLSVGFDQVACSPLLRARQTAEQLILFRRLELLKPVSCEALEPSGRAKKLFRFVRQANVERIALIGHEPDLGEHAAWLIGSKKARITFAKAGIACLKCDQSLEKGACELQWLLTPDWFKRP